MTERRNWMPPLSKRLTTAEIADLLGIDPPRATDKARRWLISEGIGHQAKSGRWYTTVAELAQFDEKSLFAELMARARREAR